MFKKLLSTLAASSMLAGLFTVMPIVTPQPEAVAAPPGSAFDPGLIISDSVFYDFGTMTVQDIQDFLDSRVSDCRAEPGGPPCLKDFVADTQAMPASAGRCEAIPARTAATAAEIIYDVSNACGINPEVLIVTLQKEQGIVTSTKPTEYMYRAAMGYGCPDSDPGICGKVYVGLFNQLYRAASQLQWYGNPEGSFTWLRPGRTVNVRYNPRASCGTMSFELKSQATANLYYYTPYTPNKAALDNLYGTGDSCSAYGNRNFWRFFHDWFGSPIGGGYLLQSSGSGVFVIAGSKKHPVNDPAMISALSALGPVGEISQPYLNSFETGDPMQLLVRSGATDELYLLAGDQRLLIDDPSLAAEFGLNTSNSLTLPSAQLLAFRDGGSLRRLVQTDDGSQFWIENGKYRQVIDQLALSTLGVAIPQPMIISLSQLPALTAGAPLASELTMFEIEGSSAVGLSAGGKVYQISASVQADIPFDDWFEEAAGSVTEASIANTKQDLIPFVVAPDGSGYVLSAAGKQKLTNVSSWHPAATAVPQALLDKIPTVSGELSTPVVAGFSGSNYGYLINSGTRKTSLQSGMTTELRDLFGQEKTLMLPRSAIISIPHAGAAVAPGSVIRGTANKAFLVDGFNSRIELSETAQAKSVSDGGVYRLSDSLLGAIPVNGKLTNSKVSCGGATYMLDKGQLIPISTEIAAEYPGTAVELDNSTCLAMGERDFALGQFVRDENRTIWVVSDGKRYKVSSWSAYLELVGDARGYIWMTNWFVSNIPSAGNVPSNFSLVGEGEIADGDFGEIPSDTGSAQAPAEPTPAPTPAPTPPQEPSTQPEAPTTNEPEFIEYRVVAGDFLSKIAARFGVTVDEIVEASNISNPNRISVGQRLLIPNPDYVGSTRPQNPTPAPAPAPAPTPSPEPTPAPTTPAPSTGTVEYRVVSGDTLSRIAFRFGVTVDQIVAASNLASANFIYVGQVLSIPSQQVQQTPAPAPSPAPEPAPTRYTVVSGDTLFRIAAKLGVSTSDLIEANSITNPNLIRVGQVLVIP